MVNFNEIVENDYVLSKDGLKWIEFNKSINILKSKYPNIFDDFNSLDGFAFPSNDYVTRFKGLTKKVKGIKNNIIEKLIYTISVTNNHD